MLLKCVIDLPAFWRVQNLFRPSTFFKTKVLVGDDPWGKPEQQKAG